MIENKNDEIMALLYEIKATQKTMETKLDDLESTLDKREHIDKIVMEHRLLLMGNGKPGYASIRDKVTSWEGKFTALSLLVVGSIITQILVSVFSAP